MSTVEKAIKKNRMRIERKAYIKRMQSSDGLFESDWFEITKDVKKWGRIRTSADSVLTNKFRLHSNVIKLANDTGRYNPETEPESLWYEYLGQQRTLLKISAVLLDETLTSEGIWVRTRFPSKGFWDVDYYDNSQWDERGANFIGLIQGDPFLSNKNEVDFNVMPLTQVFKDFPAEKLTGWTATGLTAQQFVEMLRDFTDNNGTYVFRPFFGNTTTEWSIGSTSIVYGNLNTSGSKDIEDKDCWQVIEKLAEAENYVPMVKKNGIMFFGPKTETGTIQYEFHGAGSFSTRYGHTIKKITRYGTRISKFYNRVRLKWQEADTTTSYITNSADFTVSADNLPWRLGYRTLEINNTWISSTATASTLASSIFNEVSAFKKEIEFTTSFIPHLEVLDLVTLSYDASKKSSDELWDVNNWDDLVWARPGNDALRFSNKQFKLISQEIDLDKLETKFIAREV